MTWEDAEDKYYETHDCNSDERDAEVARIERWVEDNGHKVNE